jgi:MinD-like ATPase involved in chromosome partitioning or flagellar assembly
MRLPTMAIRLYIIDTDPQCNSTYLLLGNLDQSKTLFEVLLDNFPIEQAIIPTKHKNLFVVRLRRASCMTVPVEDSSRPPIPDWLAR